jgi:hypothetical protein
VQKVNGHSILEVTASLSYDEKRVIDKLMWLMMYDKYRMVFSILGLLILVWEAFFGLSLSSENHALGCSDLYRWRIGLHKPGLWLFQCLD